MLRHHVSKLLANPSDKRRLRRAIVGLAVFVMLVAFASDRPALPQLASRNTQIAPHPSAELQRFYGHNGVVTSITFAFDSRAALSGAADGSLILWDAATGRMLNRFTGHRYRITSVALAPDGRTALAGSCDYRGIYTDATCTTGELYLWDVRTGWRRSSFMGHRDGIIRVAFAPDGRTIFSVTSSNIVTVWDVQTRRAIRSFGSEGATTAAAFSADGKLAATGKCKTYDWHEGVCSRNEIVVWEIETGVVHRTIQDYGWVMGMAFAPDGQTLVAALCSSGYAGDCHRSIPVTWDVMTGNLIQSYTPAQGSLITHFAFNPDGQTFLAASNRGLTLWDVHSGDVLDTFAGHPEWEPTTVAITPNGQAALSGACAERDADHHCTRSEFILWDMG